MVKIWHVAESPAPDWLLREWLRREDGVPRLNYELDNFGEMIDAGLFKGKARDKPGPSPKLAITRNDFDFDFFVVHLWMFVSEHLMQVMDLNSSDYGFFDVDGRDSEPLPRSKNYKMMEIYASEDVTDPSGARFETYQPYPHSDPFTELRGVTIRPDASPKRPLFYDPNTEELFCTEALAIKVLKAGCTGLNFVEPSEFKEEQPLIRTLRGVERLMDLDLDTAEQITEFVHKSIRLISG